MSPLLKNMDKKKLMINQVVRNANQLKEEIETSLKMRKNKMFRINQTNNSNH